MRVIKNILGGMAVVCRSWKAFNFYCRAPLPATWATFYVNAYLASINPKGRFPRSTKRIEGKDSAVKWLSGTCSASHHFELSLMTSQTEDDDYLLSHQACLPLTITTISSHVWHSGVPNIRLGGVAAEIGSFLTGLLLRFLVRRRNHCFCYHI